MVVVLGISYFSLVLGELVPKRLAMQRPERIASAVARPLWFLSLIGIPVVWFLSISTETPFGFSALDRRRRHPSARKRSVFCSRKGPRPAFSSGLSRRWSSGFSGSATCGPATS